MELLQYLQAKAEYDGETIPLSLRVAWDKDSDGIIYDLTNKKWQCVKITKEGWQIINETPVPLFMRYSQTPQVEPSRQYEPDILDKFLQLVNLKREENKILLVVYMATLFIPEIQHVVLQLHGEQGGAKSMLETFIKELVDPARPKLLSVHKDRMEFIQQIAHNHLVFYDNLDHIPGWLSDEVCRGVTGAGSSKRVLYSDDEDFVYDYRRCFGFNGINPVLTKPDVLDRSITIEQDRIDPKYRVQEKLMMSKFYELRPRLLGYIFDILVKALQIYPTLKLGSLPRMGDSALWGEAISRAMGYRELEFINIYDENKERQNIEIIENSPLGQVIARFLNDWQNDLKERPACWFAPTSEFLTGLNNTAAEYNIDPGKFWPKRANSLTRKLKVIMTSIREGLGYDITISRNTSGKNKGLSVTSIRKIPSPSSPSSLDENQARNEGKSSEDIFPSEDMNHSSEDISSPENWENRAQNGDSEGSEGSEDIFRTVVAASTDSPQESRPTPSDSNSVYAGLITEEHLPSLNRTVYRCKEHPEVPYYELEGIEESHFKAYHNNNTDMSTGTATGNVP